MLEHTATFTPADGGPPRTITLRISDVRRTGESWSAQVEVLGFGPVRASRVHGADWAQAIQLAAWFVASECQQDGTLDPPIYPPLERTYPDDEDTAISPRRLHDRLRAWWAMRRKR